LLVGLGLALAGCGQQDGLVPVKGKVLYKGEPVPKGTVAFIPDTAKGNKGLHRPQGVIGPQGDYELVTSNKRGVPPGPYIATVSTAYDVDTLSRTPPKTLTPLRYWDPQKSGLTIEVREDAPPGSYDLNLQP
jgi:hypothetical protein